MLGLDCKLSLKNVFIRNANWVRKTAHGGREIRNVDKSQYDWKSLQEGHAASWEIA